MNARATRFPLFDSLRAIAAISVLAFHAGIVSGLLSSNSWLKPYAARLDVGVSVFFLISGFLLYRPFTRARLLGESQPQTGAYAWRRFLRIVPAYWVALTIITICLGLPRVFSAAGIPIYYAFGQIYGVHYYLGGISQAWTLCVEITFYAFLPLWAFAMRALPSPSSRRNWFTTELAGLALLALFAMAWKVIVLLQQDPNSFNSQPWLMPLPNFLDQFAIGMALAVLSVHYEDAEELPGPLRVVGRLPGLSWLLALVAFWAVSTQVGFNGSATQTLTNARFLERHVLYTAVAFFLLLPAIFGDQTRGGVRHVLAGRGLLYLGLISYGIYLWHAALFTQLENWGVHIRGGAWAFLAWTGIVLACAAVIATLSYYLVERPALSLKNRVGRRREPAVEGEAISEPAPLAPPTV
ncbi:MAG TPA: acyltransferase [Thermoleophilaceae bacterium]